MAQKQSKKQPRAQHDAATTVLHDMDGFLRDTRSVEFLPYASTFFCYYIISVVVCDFPKVL